MTLGDTSRIDGIIHDDVLATLLVAALDSEPDATAVARHASRALERLDALRAVAGERPALPVSELDRRLRSLATDIDPDVCFRGHLAPDQELAADVCEAVVGATGEALRNSVRHARPSGGRVTRIVDARIDSDLIAVAVVDDGMGFDANEMMPQRLGLTTSIVDRMAAIPGGRAEICSHRGAGTLVAISWRRTDVAGTGERPDRMASMRRLEQVESIAGAALRRIASGAPIFAGERRQFLAVEGAVRDLIRGETFAVEPLSAIVRAARLRGVDVVLLDDLRDAEVDDQDRARIARWVSERLTSTENGTFTARVTDSAGTIVVTAVSGTNGQSVLRLGGDDRAQLGDP